MSIYPLERLKPNEAALLLRRLLEVHPDLVSEAEEMAREGNGVIHDRYKSRGNGDSPPLAGYGSPGVPMVEFLGGSRSLGVANGRAE